MNKSLKRVLQIGIPVVIVGAIVIPRLDFFSNKDASTPTTAPQAANRGALPVTGMVASMSTSGNGIPVTGVLVANEEVELVSETAGKVVKIAFEEGALVKKGTLLVKVDDSDLQAQLARAEFQKELLAAKLERQRILLKRESISVEEFQQLETEYNMNLADIELLKVRIARTEIRAPFDGRMGFRFVSEGSYLQSSTKVSSIVDNSYLKIEFSIPEKYIDLPLVGRKLTFQPSGMEYQIEAEVYAVDPQADVSDTYDNLAGSLPEHEKSGSRNVRERGVDDGRESEIHTRSDRGCRAGDGRKTPVDCEKQKGNQRTRANRQSEFPIRGSYFRHTGGRHRLNGRFDAIARRDDRECQAEQIEKI